MSKVLALFSTLFFATMTFAANGSELFDAQKDPNMNLTTATGIWSAPDQTNNGFTFGLRLKIETTQIQSAVRCQFAGATGYASVTVPVKVTATTFEILKSAKVETKFGKNYTCTAQADKTPATPYEVRLGTMYINGQLLFEKVKDL